MGNVAQLPADELTDVASGTPIDPLAAPGDDAALECELQAVAMLMTPTASAVAAHRKPRKDGCTGVR
jgi:hypothetical protein